MHGMLHRTFQITPRLRVGLMLLAAAALSACSKSADAPGAKKPVSAPASAEAAGDFSPLKGRWARQDGDYMIEISAAAPDGALDAKYFNPRPIHVGKAQAEMRDGDIRVFVLLADVGYPGSNYKLRYDKASGTLQGTYLQAASGESFAVIFSRLE
jgi:hypothetical protein